MTQFVHHIPNGILDATADDIVRFCETIHQQAQGIADGSLDLDAFIEDRLDDHEQQADIFNVKAHRHHNCSREAHGKELKRVVAQTARAVAKYDRAWWVLVTENDEHCLFGVSMAVDPKSGIPVTNYRMIQDCSDIHPEAYAVPANFPAVTRYEVSN